LPKDDNPIIVPISKKTMMSLEFSMMKDVMESLLIGSRGISVGRKIPVRLPDKCELRHRQLFPLHPDCQREGVSSPLHPRRPFGGVFLFRKMQPPRHAFRPVKAIDQTSNVALPGAASRTQSTVGGAHLGKRIGRS
jgi:hypothetical protein